MSEKECTEAEELSVSRPASRVSWAIEVPEDPSHTVYVWLDALCNYLTAAGYNGDGDLSMWPPDHQILGKDILKFHSIYWPSFLAGMVQSLSCSSPQRSTLDHLVQRQDWHYRQNYMYMPTGKRLTGQRCPKRLGTSCVHCGWCRTTVQRPPGASTYTSWPISCLARCLTACRLGTICCATAHRVDETLVSPKMGWLGVVTMTLRIRLATSCLVPRDERFAPTRCGRALRPRRQTLMRHSER